MSLKVGGGKEWKKERGIQNLSEFSLICAAKNKKKRGKTRHIANIHLFTFGGKSFAGKKSGGGKGKGKVRRAAKFLSL